ncbi:hypothetical protein CHARACLAT_026476 [Characodon lateralis]|uniref:Uncharacterized protein n=1 Tax=Characodon lateralis TaxID=208331 RepID=A0ABU7E4F1_9TELE|nr:hypothetical protein [Characodon lateralis]
MNAGVDLCLFVPRSSCCWEPRDRLWSELRMILPSRGCAAAFPSRVSDLSQYCVCKEEGVSTDISNQEGNSTLDQEEPEPLQIKQEQEELEHQQFKEEEEQLCISKDEEQVVLKQETDDILAIPSIHNELEPGTNSLFRPPLKLKTWVNKER